MGSVGQGASSSSGSLKVSTRSRLSVLLVGSSPENGEIVVRSLERSGLTFESRRVEDEPTFLAGLEPVPDVVIADCQGSRFSAERALALLRKRGLDVPFIVVSGGIGEERAAALVREGASDYLLRDELGRLGEAIRRAREDQLLRREDASVRTALEVSDSTFRRLADNAQDLTFRYRADPGCFDYVSPAAVAMSGYGPEEFYADPGLAFRLAHPDDRQSQHRAFTAGTDGWPVILRWIRPDGRLVWTEQRSTGVASTAGSPEAVEGVIRDVTATGGRTAREEEARRISGDIHDDAIQIMAATSMTLGLLARELTDPVQQESLRGLQEVVGEAIGRLRRLMVDVRPNDLEERGLTTVLKEYLSGSCQGMGVTSEFHCDLAADPAPETQAALFRIAVEALANISRHAQATHVEMRLEEMDEGVGLSIIDDGVGLAAEVEASPPGHLGVTGMRERAQALGGWCRVTGRPGEGATVASWLPRHLPGAAL